MMLWGRPEALWLLLLLPPLAAAFLWAHAARRRALREFASREEAYPEPGRTWRAALKGGMLLLASACLILALADPRYGRRPFSVRARGVDVMVLLDTSRSMLARDERPTRLDRARRGVLDLLKRLRGDRIAILPFSGDAFLACPLTIDYGAARMVLDDIDIGSIRRGGTDLARALDVALAAFRRTRLEEGEDEQAPVRFGAVVILTDGGDHSGRALEAVREAREAGVEVYILGIGGDAPVPIPLPVDSAEPRYVRDAAGERVRTRLEEEALRTLAEAGGGFYARLDPHNRALDRLYDDGIARIEGRVFQALESRLMIRRYRIPLLLGLVLLVAEACLSRRAFRVSPDAGGFGAALPAALMLALAATPARAAEGGSYREAVRENNIGVELAERGELSAAGKRFEAAAGLAPGENRAMPLINLAETLLRQGKADQATEAYTHAMDVADAEELARIHYGLGRLGDMAGDERLPEAFADGIPPEARTRLAPEEVRGQVASALQEYTKALSAYGRSLAALAGDEVPPGEALVPPQSVRHNHERTWRRIRELESWLEAQQALEEEQEQQQKNQNEQQQNKEQNQDQQQQSSEGESRGDQTASESEESETSPSRGGSDSSTGSPQEEQAGRDPENGTGSPKPREESTGDEEKKQQPAPASRADSGEERPTPEPPAGEAPGEAPEPDRTGEDSGGARSGPGDKERDATPEDPERDGPPRSSAGTSPGRESPSSSDVKTAEDAEADGGTTQEESARADLLYRRLEEQEKAARRARRERAISEDPQVEKDW